jgi:hypothetical protein
VQGEKAHSKLAHSRKVTGRNGPRDEGRPSRLWRDWDEGRCKDRRKREDRVGRTDTGKTIRFAHQGDVKTEEKIKDRGTRDDRSLSLPFF